MKRTGLVLLVIAGLFSCKNKDIPNVSNIKVELTVKRFEQDFFAIDSNHLMTSLEHMGPKYPLFLGDFLYNIMELPGLSDTSQQELALLKKFIGDYKPVKDSADQVFRNFTSIENDVKKGLQFVKYYFPAYKPPTQLITYIGPMEGYSDVITRDALAVGLQLHMGKNYSLYQSSMGQAVFPGYISRRFTPDYIVVNCMKNIINDISPEKGGSRPLVEQMVEKGKRLYVLDKILPFIEDSLKTGYTAAQLTGSYKNEGLIWNHFLSHNLLFTIEPADIRPYMEEAPNTPEISEQSPGAIGIFVGWQIVKKYMDKHSALSLNELLNTDAKIIFEESKYRPN
ncbi:MULTISPECIES: gliding motility lipoprotein GldB [Niastella]|uniref:Gliding motility lipoprotein GldB n=1 Tax=Niastella soli TaxID=2821487 RepID=A0ABS3YMK3_9BACT|nr:hypothetical protein [Niastella soli]MBO9199126.1 hypothetical protein [Niastella soli]